VEFALSLKYDRFDLGTELGGLSPALVMRRSESYQGGYTTCATFNGHRPSPSASPGAVVNRERNRRVRIGCVGLR